MSDSYQATFDAVRSQFRYCDASRVIQEVAAQQFDFSHARAILQEQIGAVGSEMSRPSVLYRPSIGMDGTKWCALYGDDLMHGIAGFGDTPDEAMRDFDNAWWKEKT